MNLQLSSEAWIALGCLAGVVLLSGAVLWAAWRRGIRSKHSPLPAEKSEGPSFDRAWKKEDEQLAELAQVANDLRAQRLEQPENRTPQD